MKRRGVYLLLGLSESSFVMYAVLTVASIAADLIITLALAGLLRALFDAAATSDPRLLARSLTGMTVLTIWMGTAYPLIGFWARALHRSITGDIRKRVFAHVLSLPMSDLRSSHSGELISRLNSDISVCEEGYAVALPELLSGVTVSLLSLGWMLLMDWQNAAFALAMAAVGAIVNLRAGTAVRRLSLGVQESIAKVASRLSDILRGLRLVKVFDLKAIVLNKLGVEDERARLLSLRIASQISLLTAANNLLANLTFAGVLCIGAYRYLGGFVTLGTSIAMVQLLSPVSNLFLQAGELVRQLSTALAAASRIDEIMHFPKEPRRWQVSPANLRVEPATTQGDEGVTHREWYIEMADVYFGYAPDQPVLNGFSLKVRNGQVVALVGPSGGGKSTVFRLLAGLYPVDRGIVVVGGIPIEHQDLNDLRSKISLVPQDTHLFSGSIAENIGAGRSDCSLQDIVDAAKAAHVHEFVSSMKDGYSTLVGDLGGQLSGGQRQCVTIARAILKNAPILLLDEATSALDPRTEDLIRDALSRLMEGKTAVIIAHRLSTIERADKIVFVREGRAVEEGCHADLLSRPNSEYSRLFAERFSPKRASFRES